MQIRRVEDPVSFRKITKKKELQVRQDVSSNV